MALLGDLKERMAKCKADVLDFKKCLKSDLDAAYEMLEGNLNDVGFYYPVQLLVWYDCYYYMTCCVVARDKWNLFAGNMGSGSAYVSNLWSFALSVEL
jgi:hypothetical protein